MSWTGTPIPRRRLFAAAVLVLCLAAALGRGAASEGASPAPTTLRVTVASLPDYLDPQLSYTNEGWAAMYNTYIPLLTFRHASGRAAADLVPGLAEDLPEVSDGGRTYTLFLRPGLRYSDGTPVRASDFEYAIKRMFELNSGGTPFYFAIAGARSFSRSGRGGISGITSNNETGRITIHLLRSDGAFDYLLALPFAAPVPPDTPMQDRTFSPPPATGPYAITRSEPGVGWSYARNPAWATGNGPLLPQLPGGHMDRIEVRVIREEDAQIKGVLSGKLDWMQNPPSADRFGELRRKYGGTRFRAESTLTTNYFWMNTTKPPFDDVRVRRAVNFAVDRSVLRRIYRGQITPSQQILPPGMPGYRKLELYPYDLKKARRLIAAADPSDREVTVWASTEARQPQAASYYRSQLQKLGFRARLKLVDAISYLFVVGNRSTPNLDTGWGNWFADYSHPDDFFRPLLLGSNIRRFFNGNFARIDVPALDARIEKLRQRRLGPACERRYAALDRSYMKLAPWVPYGSFTASTFVSKAVDLDGIVWNPLFGADLASFRFEDR